MIGRFNSCYGYVLIILFLIILGFKDRIIEDVNGILNWNDILIESCKTDLILLKLCAVY